MAAGTGVGRPAHCMFPVLQGIHSGCDNLARLPARDVKMPAETDKRALLDQLRIDRTDGEAGAVGGRRPWIIGGLVLVAALVAAGVWLALSGGAALPVHTAVAQPIMAGGGNASVLD